jgi:hypothetical protein
MKRITYTSNGRASNNYPCHRVPNDRIPISVRDGAGGPNGHRYAHKRHCGIPILHRSIHVLGWEARYGRSPVQPGVHARVHRPALKPTKKALWRKFLLKGPERPTYSSVFSFVRFLVSPSSCNSYTQQKTRQDLPGYRILYVERPLLPVSPMTGLPYMSPAVMGPMTGDPCPSVVGRQRPMTACMHINAIVHLPFFTDPYMSRAGGGGPHDNRRHGTHIDIDLSRGGKRSGHHEDSYHGENAEMLFIHPGDRFSK